MSTPIWSFLFAKTVAVGGELIQKTLYFIAAYRVHRMTIAFRTIKIVV
jgi:hypothetical protein